ncbi:DMT family transporter [Marivita sp. S2033]|uniref:DMT family transporter n=1 Tax=Marivita sp. S2033 TaxID=3373187 RepID=UPI0039822DBE
MTQQTSLSTRAWIELSLLGLIWGGSFLAIRTALDEIGPLTSVLHRTFWAMLVLWVVVIVRKEAIPRSLRIWGAFLVMGVLNNVIPFSLMAWGQLYIPSGLTSIFNAATAIFGIVVAALVFADERLSPRKALGVGIGFSGVCMAIGLDALAQFDTTSLAQLAIVAGTLSYAFASAWARKMLGGISPLVAAAGMLTGSSLVMVPLAMTVEGLPSFALGAAIWAAIGYYAIIATAVAYLLYYRVLAMAGSGNLLLVTLIIPPVAITLGAVVRHETLHPGEYLGFALLALGLSIIDGRLWRRAATTV